MTAYQLGQLFGIGILVFVLVGAARTLLRGDLTLREKVLGVREDD